MLLIQSIEIKNFVCFEHIVIEPSRNSSRPLTIIRAENGSGKTTLLRAIRWGMYGEQSLPGTARNFSLHPADWIPDKTGVQTSVTILFETDGSSRQNTAGGRKSSLFQLKRVVTTVGKVVSKDGEPDFGRVNEHAYLQYQLPDGSWDQHQAGVEAVINELLPWELRDFFVMDADEAADYVGGTEAKDLKKSDVVAKTTYAVEALLGLDVFRKSADRLDSISREFGRKSAKAAGNISLSNLQSDLERSRNRYNKLQKGLKSNREEESDKQSRLEQDRAKLESLVGNIHAHEQLGARLEENRVTMKNARRERDNELEQFSRKAVSIQLFRSLAKREIDYVRNKLQPMYDDGTIPARHLDYVKGLLEKGVCVCGQDLAGANQFGLRVQEVLQKSSESKEMADWLAGVLESANTLQHRWNDDEWTSMCDTYEARLAELDERLNDLESTKNDLENQVSDIDDQKLQVIRNRIAMLEKQHAALQRKIVTDELELKPLQETIHEKEASIRNTEVKTRESEDQRLNQDVSQFLAQILRNAYSNIRTRQVAELDSEMNNLFNQMAANVTDDALIEKDRGKATLAMIAKVGLRPSRDDEEKFEIFAINSRGRTMPPTEINGASRRILALSFVLALCKESQTMAPLVADSLLNFMSGSVRTNTLRVTAQNSSQPILLLTGSDLESSQEAKLVEEFAGATYTLTAQWQHTSEGGDVVHLTSKNKVSLLCQCGPREYCTICERHGQATKHNWVRIS